MSYLIGVKLKLKTDWESEQTSDCIFSIVRYGCEKKVGVDLENDYRAEYELANDEGLLYIDHSLIVQNCEALICEDQHFEVRRYRPLQPLFQRLNLLQDLFAFILSQDTVINMEVYITDDEYYLLSKKGRSYAKKSIYRQTRLENFAKETEQLINNAGGFGFDFLYCWEK